MLVVGSYRRERALEYARRWALSRNPLFADFAGIGGDCTNFVSQCLYAGCCQMNFTPVFGWYYISKDDRAAAFSGVEYFYNFIVGNEGVGPFAEESDAASLMVGDVVELGREGEGYYHALLVVGRSEEGEILVAAHTNDALDRPLSTYTFDMARYLHIAGVRYPTAGIGDCYAPMLAGEALLIRGEGEGKPSPLPLPPILESEDQLIEGE